MRLLHMQVYNKRNSNQWNSFIIIISCELNDVQILMSFLYKMPSITLTLPLEQINLNSELKCHSLWQV